MNWEHIDVPPRSPSTSGRTSSVSANGSWRYGCRRRDLAGRPSPYDVDGAMFGGHREPMEVLEVEATATLRGPLRQLRFFVAGNSATFEP